MRPEGTFRAIQVHALELVQGCFIVQLGIRGPGQDFDVMSKFPKLDRQIARVNTLAPGMRVSPIGEDGYAEVFRGPGTHRGITLR
jgi:hypothetical protein